MIDPPTSHSVTVSAAEQDHLIDSVTIFQAGRAEIKRRIQLQLKKGQNQITVERLASCLTEDSLRVQGTGTAVIYDVVHHSPKPKPRHDRRQVDNDSSDEEENEELIECYNAVEAIKKQRTVVENQISYLDRYGRSIYGKNSNTESLEHFLDVYGSRRDALDTKVQELNMKVDQAEKVLRRVGRRKPGRETKGQRRTKIIITVMLKEESKAELMLAYVVSNASWIPIYDIRASVSSSPNSPSTIALHYRASLTRTTGEDWPEVALTLSTATPYRGNGIFTHGAIAITFTFIFTDANHAGWREVKIEVKITLTLPTRIAEPRELVSHSSHGLPPQVVRVRTATTLSGPSRMGMHTTKRRECVPECKIVNSSEFTFLPGEASIFIGDSFVSKSQIQHVPPNDSFQLSLGTDPTLRMTYIPLRTHKGTHSQPRFTFPGRQRQPKQITTEYSQHITTRNTRPTAVSALHILDHVPVSGDSTIKVDVTSPQGLREGGRPTEDGSTEKQHKEWVRPQKGVQARWAPPEIGGEGAIEWVCSVDAREEMELKLEWEVKTHAHAALTYAKRNLLNGLSFPGWITTGQQQRDPTDRLGDNHTRPRDQLMIDTMTTVEAAII
ncbi:hypothetical protein B0J17DRAFT_712306 [Rhizoctonia solani]|nr:hypothetical protein B0J17DRAFT_712306 [Rhizoctonia solani]